MNSDTKAHTQRHSKFSPPAAVLCLLLSAGCVSPFEDMGKERTVTIRVSGTVSSASDGSAINGATVTLERIVLAADTGPDILARTESGTQGRYSISRQVRCTSWALFEVGTWTQGYSRASETLGGCRDVEKVIHFRLTTPPSGP
jgi:hypothetical protein